MRIKPNLKLRRIGSRHMLVDVCASNINLTNVYTLNETAAFLWESVADTDFNEATLATLLIGEYDVDLDRALADSRSLLELWIRQGLVTD